MVDSNEFVVKALSDVPPENNFWVCDGSVLKNLDELNNALKGMNNEVYMYHANADKNDFSNWIKDVVEDAKLAESLIKSRDRKNAVRVLDMRLKWLKRKTAPHHQSHHQKH